MTLLSVIQDVSDRIGLPRPAAGISSNDQSVRTLIALANKEGKMLAKRWSWQALQKEYTWTTLAATKQFTIATAIPDFDYLIEETIYNRSQFRQLGGPLDPQEWQRLKANNALGPYPQYRVQGGDLNMIPTPTAGATAALEYYSKNWCASASGTGQSAWAADSDVGVLSEDLMSAGIEWRYREAKGLGYDEVFRDYEQLVNNAIARDGGKRTLVLDASDMEYDPRRSVAPPDGSWQV